MIIVLASNNSIKKDALSNALNLIYPDTKFNIIQVDAEREGPEPFGEDATLKQISKSIDIAKSKNGEADFYVGMEGGVVESNNGMDEIAFVVIDSKENRRSISRSVSFSIPEEVARLVKDGMPFGSAVDLVYGTNNIKNGEGFVGMLTNNIVNKKELYLQPLLVAFSKFNKVKWYWK